MNNRTKAAAIGGGLAGILSALPILGSCCFLWALAGGVLAVFMYQKNAGGPMSPGDGAKLGALAGAIGAGIYLVIALPMMLLSGGAAMSEALRQSGGGDALGAGALAGLGAFIVVVVAAIIVGLTAVGGMIGAAIFGKGAGTPPPPPPPAGGFGGGPTGGPAGGSFGQGS